MTKKQIKDNILTKSYRSHTKVLYEKKKATKLIDVKHETLYELTH